MIAIMGVCNKQGEEEKGDVRYYNKTFMNHPIGNIRENSLYFSRLTGGKYHQAQVYNYCILVIKETNFTVTGNSGHQNEEARNVKKKIKSQNPEIAFSFINVDFSYFFFSHHSCR